MDTAILADNEMIGASSADPEMALTGNQFVDGSEFFRSDFDRLAEHGDGKLNSDIARNSLYVKFDPLLGRPSVLPEITRLAARAQDEAVPPVPRQVSAVKADLINFSPGKELLEAVPAVPQPDVMPAPALPKSEMLNLNSPQLHDALKKQELHFQDLLLKRDLAENATQEQNAKLKQQVVGLQAALQKSNKVLEMYSATMVRLAAEKESQRDDLTLGVKMLTSERDEAREEVANIEAMFADLHRKYEKSKTMMQENRRQADAVSNSYRTALEENNRERQRYDLLQQHAEDTLQQLREDVEVAGKTQETEMLRMSAKLQLSENRATKLERENQEVTAICDELIQKMGGR